MTVAIAFILYLAVLMFLTYRGYATTKTSTDYLLAGRKSHPVVMALSYGATFISTSAVIGFGGMAANTGFGLLWLTFLNVIIGIFIAFVFFGKRTHKLGLELDAHTFPELLGKRFNSRMLQISAGLMIFIFMPIYAAAIIKGGVNYIETYFHIPYDVSLIFFVSIVAVYVLSGGIKAVMYTDVFQGLILFVAMLVLLVVAYVSLGGITTAHLKLTNLFHEPAIQNDIAGQVSQGFLGWTSMPAFNSPMWWSLISSVLGAVGFGVLAQPQLVVRFMTVKSTKELNRAVLSGGLFILVMTAGAYVVGSLSNVIVFNDMGVISRVAAGGVSDKIIPFFITQYLPQWYSALFLLSILAASMSTLSSQFHSMGSALGRDVGGVLMPKHRDSIAINRYGILIVILISLVLAWGAKYLDVGEAIIAKGTIIFFEMTLCAFLAVYMGAIFSKTMPRLAAEAGMLAGFATWFLWTFFIASNAKNFGLSQLLFGKSMLLENTPLEGFAIIGSSIIGLTVSVIALLIGWKVHSVRERKAHA